MKILFAECCGTLVVPNKKENKPKSCDCGKSYVWWENSLMGRLVIYAEDRSLISVLGLHNGLLTHDMGNNYAVLKDDIKEIVDDTPDSYLFKTYGSLIIRVKVGITNDMRWADKKEYDELI